MVQLASGDSRTTSPCTPALELKRAMSSQTRTNAVRRHTQKLNDPGAAIPLHSSDSIYWNK